LFWLLIIFKCQFIDLPFRSQITNFSTHLKNLKMGIVKWPLKQLCDEKDIKICSYIHYWEVLHNLAQNASTKCITCTCRVHYLHFETTHFAFKLLHMPPKNNFTTICSNLVTPIESNQAKRKQHGSNVWWHIIILHVLGELKDM
jgi:hypothetical protein